jgi:hypothetical protein
MVLAFEGLSTMTSLDNGNSSDDIGNVETGS